MRLDSILIPSNRQVYGGSHLNQEIKTNHRNTRTSAKLERIMLLALLAFAILLRLVPIFALPSIPLYGDMVHYDHSATMLITHHVYTYWASVPNAQVTPGYPFFLAAVYMIAGLASHSHYVEMHLALIVQAILSGLTVGVLYKIVRTMMSHGWAFVAAFLWAVYPPSVWASQLLLTETLFVFFLYLFVWSFIWAMRRKTSVSWLVAGLLLGLTGLVRPTVFPLLAAPVAVALWQARKKTKADSTPTFVHFFQRAYASLRWQSFTAYVIGFVALLLPWWIRNFVVFHKIILTDTDAGNPLLYGTDPNYAHDPSLAAPGQNETTLALERIREQFTHQPLAALKWYTLGKLHDLFTAPWYPSISNATPTWLAAWIHLHIVWVIAGGLGLILSLTIPGLRLLAALALFLIVAQLPFIPVNRYAFPIMPLFMIGVAVISRSAVGLVKQMVTSPPRQPQQE